VEFIDIKAAIERPRRFSHEIDGRVFDLIVPTQFAADLALEEARTNTRIKRRVVSEALRGWMHLTLADLKVPDAALPAEPLVYSPEMVELLLDARPDIEWDLFAELGRRVGERRKYLEDQKGN